MDLYRNFMHWVNGLDRQGWLLFMTGVCVAGFLMLRGLGSRSRY